MEVCDSSGHWGQSWAGLVKVLRKKNYFFFLALYSCAPHWRHRAWKDGEQASEDKTCFSNFAVLLEQNILTSCICLHKFSVWFCCRWEIPFHLPQVLLDSVHFAIKWCYGVRHCCPSLDQFFLIFFFFHFFLSFTYFFGLLCCFFTSFLHSLLSFVGFFSILPSHLFVFLPFLILVFITSAFSSSSYFNLMKGTKGNNSLWIHRTVLQISWYVDTGKQNKKQKSHFTMSRGHWLLCACVLHQIITNWPPWQQWHNQSCGFLLGFAVRLLINDLFLWFIRRRLLF